MLENQGSQSSLLTGFTRNSKWEHLHLNLGANHDTADAWAHVAFTAASKAKEENSKLFVGRVASPNELLVVVRAIRALIGAPCPVSMTVQWIWPQWTSDQLDELSDLLDIRTFYFKAANSWTQLLRSDTTTLHWPNLESVSFPPEIHPACLAADALTKAWGGAARFVMDGKVTKCCWMKGKAVEATGTPLDHSLPFGDC